jgi:hypothetical protein
MQRTLRQTGQRLLPVLGRLFGLYARALVAEVTCRNLRTATAQVEIALFRPGKDRPIDRQTVSLALTRPDSERATTTAAFYAARFRLGTYRSRAVVRDHDGRQLAASESACAYAARPDWLGSKLGRAGRVLPPHAPVELAREGENSQVAASVWGRSYEFAGGLVSQVVTREAPMLAAPVRLVARLEDGEVVWQTARPKVVKRTPAEAVVRYEDYLSMVLRGARQGGPRPVPQVGGTGSG